MLACLRVSSQAHYRFALDLSDSLGNKSVCVFQDKRNKRKKNPNKFWPSVDIKLEKEPGRNAVKTQF